MSNFGVHVVVDKKSWTMKITDTDSKEMLLVFLNKNIKPKRTVMLLKSAIEALIDDQQLNREALEASIEKVSSGREQ